MTRVLILFAHPALEKSRIHRRLIREVAAVPGVTLNDLYECYPNFDVDVRREQELLLAHDLIVVQHPLYWYSTPAILKQWQDLVLEHGWPYGSTGTALRGKRMLSLISAGGRDDAYRREGYNRFTIPELLTPLAQTARLCGMEYLPPFVFFGGHRLTPNDIEGAAATYRRLLTALRDDGVDFTALAPDGTLNHAFERRAIEEAA